jgi:hypothetical protein
VQASNPGTMSRSAANTSANTRTVPGFRLPSTAHVPQQNAITLIPQLPSAFTISENEITRILNQFDVLFPNLDPLVRSSVMKDLETVRLFFISFYFFFFIQTVHPSSIHTFIHSYNQHTFIHQFIVHIIIHPFI